MIDDDDIECILFAFGQGQGLMTVSCLDHLNPAAIEVTPDYPPCRSGIVDHQCPHPRKLLLGIEHPVHRLGYVAGRKRFADEVDDLELIPPLPVFQIIIGGDKDNRHLGRQLFSFADAVSSSQQPLTDLEAAHYRHIDVKGDDVRQVGHPLDHGKGFHAIFRSKHLIPDVGQFSDNYCPDR